MSGFHTQLSSLRVNSIRSAGAFGAFSPPHLDLVPACRSRSVLFCCRSCFSNFHIHLWASRCEVFHFVCACRLLIHLASLLVAWWMEARVRAEFNVRKGTTTVAHGAGIVPYPMCPSVPVVASGKGTSWTGPCPRAGIEGKGLAASAGPGVSALCHPFEGVEVLRHRRHAAVGGDLLSLWPGCRGFSACAWILEC